MYNVRIHDELNRSSNHDRIEEVVLRIISDYGELAGDSAVDVYLVNDAQMAKEGLRGDYLTAGVAVCGWDYEKSPQFYGELKVNADRAAREAPQNGCTLEEEILIYVVYGTLRFIDQHAAIHSGPPPDVGEYLQQVKQRRLEKEAKYGEQFGLSHAYKSVGESDDYKPGNSWSTWGCLVLLVMVVAAPCLVGLAAIWWAGWLDKVAIAIVVVLCLIGFDIYGSKFLSRNK